MFINELHIEEFRLFKNNSIKLGKYITAITGFNATGKSTILGLLGHCGELKVKKFKPLLQGAFKAELSEILKFSEHHDKGIPHICSLKFNDDSISGTGKYPRELSFRSTLQKQKNSDVKRYRIIPKRTAEWTSSGKIEWPTLYLGLSRLYPLGESMKVATTTTSSKLSPEDITYIINNMKAILNITQDAQDFTVASISETHKKKGVGFNTDTYNYLANSAGQDNLGQILMAVLSFKRLKIQQGDDWHGGLLLVDELDATLHPLAQQKLLNFLYSQAEEIGMQIAFTTHSLGLLEYICTKTDYNNANTTNDYELVSLTNANGPLEVEQNTSYDLIYKELMATYQAPYVRKILVWSEDEESRFFITKLLEPYSHRFKLLEVSFGYNELLKMLTSDPSNFSQYIYILDGDVAETDIDTSTARVKPAQIRRCIVKLPGGKRPEQVIWEYISQLQHDHPFLQTMGRQMGYSQRSFGESGPFSAQYNGTDPERAKYKQWFNDNKQLIEDAFEHWRNDNEDAVGQFIKDFIAAFNWTAQRCCIPIIRPPTKLEEVTNCQQAYLL